MREQISLKEAVKFHGHLGPYLVLGILAGGLALKKLKCAKYFGLSVRVWGAQKKPKSCLIDGLQLSTGATFGKGNIKKLNSREIKIELSRLDNKQRVILKFNNPLKIKLNAVKTHRDSEILAKRLYKTDSFKLFNLTTKN